MKTMKFALCLMAVLAFATGCGKDKGGGSSASGVNLYTQNLDTNSQTAVADLSAWYNGANEGSAQSQPTFVPGYGYRTPTVFTIKKYKFNSTATNSNCSSNQVSGGWLGNVLGAIGMNQYYVCSGSSNSNTQQGELVSTLPNISLAATQGQAISAKGNVELNAVVSGAKGQLLSARSYGNMVELVFLNGSLISTYKIDKSYHSLFNPVVSVETHNGAVVETRVYADIVY